jgi:xanthine dehydrogenase accessory factor
MINTSKGFHSERWQEAVASLTARHISYVLVTVLGTAGSTPRAAGSKMVVTDNDIFDTVGGGHLEFQLLSHARQLLAGESAQTEIEHFSLGASLGQCCGGSVTVLFEPIISNAFHIELFGAGHVAHQLVNLLGQLPVAVNWIDSRAELFPDDLPTNVKTIAEPFPADRVKSARKNSVFLVLTHNHQLDFELTEAVLKRGDSQFLGVIGSDTKAKRFTMRLAHKAYSELAIAHLTCPIGLASIQGKLPMEVAISIAAQIMQIYQSTQAKHDVREGIAWKDIKNQWQKPKEEKIV